MTLLEFKEIRKRFGSNLVLEDISFSIREGEIFGLIGKSGSGKSTLLRILMGVMRAGTGRILFEEQNTWRKKNSLRKATGFAAQENTLFMELTLRENAMFFGLLMVIP